MPLFLGRWLKHQRRDAYWRHGSVCEDFSAIRCPVFAVGGWTDGYTNAIPRLLRHLDVPRKGWIGPWAHAYPHFAKPGPQVGFLQEMLRWWDHWLKGKPTGVMDEPMLRAWMTASHRPARHHETLPGRWVAETVWPPADRKPHRLFLTDSGLRQAGAPLAPRDVRSSQKVGSEGGEWCPFGRGHDQAGDQRPDDARSLVFETLPLDATMEILGAPVVTLDVVCDKPVANLVARLCDVHSSGESLRVSFGVLNLAHRDGHAAPSPLMPGERYRVRLQLNDCGATFPAGHRIRLALSTSYWPMVWPAPHDATVTILGGTLDLPVRPARPEDAALPAFPVAETAEPARDTLGFELGGEGKYHLDIEDDDPASAIAEMRKVETKRRGDWRVRWRVWMRLTCTREAFRLQASLDAHEGDKEVCRREWDCVITRDLI
jgi:putative CocE/NonD family hydrolase